MKKSIKSTDNLNNLEFRCDFIAMAIVCVLSVHFFYIFGTHFHIPSSGSIGSFLALIFFGMGLLQGQRISFANYPYLLLANILILIVTTHAYVKYSEMTAMKFFAFSFMPMLLVFCKYDYKKVIRYTCYMTPLLFVVHNDLFVLHGSFDQMEMGYSYAIIHILVSNMIQFIYFKKESNFYMKLCNFASVYLLLRVFMTATRGSMLSLLVAVFLLWIIKFDDNGKYIKLTQKKKIKIFVVFVVLVIVYINLAPVLDFIETVFNKLFGATPAAIKKTLDAINSNDLSHGRDEIAIFAENAIKNKPFFGHGVLTFHYFNHYSYPHNWVLQILFEGGIVGALYQIICIVYGAFNLVFRAEKSGKEKTYCNLLICLTAFPMLFFSNEMWTTPAFWIFMVIGGRELKTSFVKNIVMKKNGGNE